MGTVSYKPDRKMNLMQACTYATVLAKKDNCIVAMNWGGILFSCNPSMTAAQFYSLVNFNLKQKV